MLHIVCIVPLPGSRVCIVGRAQNQEQDRHHSEGNLSDSANTSEESALARTRDDETAAYAVQHASHAPCGPHTPASTLAAHTVKQVRTCGRLTSGTWSGQVQQQLKPRSSSLPRLSACARLVQPQRCLCPISTRPSRAEATSTTVAAWDKIKTKRTTTAARVSTRAICCAALSHPRLVPARGDGTRAHAESDLRGSAGITPGWTGEDAVAGETRPARRGTRPPGAKACAGTAASIAAATRDRTMDSALELGK